MRYRFVHALFLLAMAMYRCAPALAADLPSEQSLRSAMVFNFLKFSEVPRDGNAGTAQGRLCIAVADPLQVEAFMALSGRKLWGGELSVARYTGRSDDCRALYVDSRQRWNAAVDQHALRQTLTISAYPGFAREGGMIEIVFEESGTRFDINLAEIRRAGIHLSPQLLRLARHVYE
ncbi:MAG: YfiR family protein [Rhodocyclaceae bacterium]|nr:YfiR family protein [Rhodocyclaceae bacterium]